MKYGLIADRIGHSFSADIHKKLFGYEYELKAVAENELDSFIRSKDFLAINVTIPYKERVIPFLDHIDPVAESIGAVNTVVNREGKLYGYNTDADGLASLLTVNQIELKDKKVLVLGSGGTSKTAAYVANSLGASGVYRISRGGKNDCITYEAAQTVHSDADVIINTTPCGMYPNVNESPIDISAFSRLSAVVDVVYNPLKTKLVCDARQRNIKVEGGLYMLVAQAAKAAEHFAGRSVEPKRIDEIYKNLYKSKENIVLVGMPGCGKTAAARFIAQRLGSELIDTDEMIKDQIGKAPCYIIKDQGETAFRDIETNVIKEISPLQGRVISTGGGAVLRKENVEALRRNGRIYFIDRPLDDIRVSDDRPLSSNRDDLKKRFEERYNIYLNCADVRIVPVDGAELNADMILEDFNENSCN